MGQLVAVLSLSPHTTGLKYLSVSLLGTLGMANHLAVSIQTHENLISFYFWCLYFLSRFERNCHKDAVLIALSNSVRPFENSIISNSKHNTKIANQCYFGEGEIIKNIAKGTTDPRVEFISQVQKQIFIKFHLQNLDQASTSKSQPNISLSIKLKLQNLDQT